MDWDKKYSFKQLFQEARGVSSGASNTSNNFNNNKSASSKYAKGGKIEESVKTFEDARNVLRINKEDVSILELTGMSERDHEAISAYYQLIIIARALNEGWVPDWGNDNQEKWYPYFEWNKKTSGFVFPGTTYDTTHTDTTVGSRLCFKSEELAEYAGKRFEKIYAKLLNP